MRDGRHRSNLPPPAAALLLLLFTSLAGGAFAADARELLAKFPTREQVMSEVRGSDDLDTAVRQSLVLNHLELMAQQFVAPFRDGVFDPDLQRLQEGYERDRAGIRDAAIRKLMRGRSGQQARLEAEMRFDAALMGFARDPAQREAVVGDARRLTAGAVWDQFARRTHWEMRKQELERLMNTPGARPSVSDIGDMAIIALRENTKELPQPIPRLVQQLTEFPAAGWAAILLAWLVLNLVRNLSPFGLSSDDPFDFRNGSRRFRVNFTAGHVVDSERWTETRTSTHTTTVTDAQGFTRSIPSTTVHATQKQRVFLRTDDGRETDIHLQDDELPVRPGHRLVEVWLSKPKQSGGRYVFFYIHEMQRTKFMPAIHDFVKLRLRIFIPLVVLGTWVATKFLGVNGYAAVIAVPIVYWIVKGIVNRRRVAKFRNDFAPRILAAIPSPRETISVGGMSVTQG